jgi:GDSL-like lipase/acylhydrolase family protein
MGFRFSRAARLVVAVGCSLALATPAGALAADRYVALGDSFSSGVGTGSYTLSSSCKRSVYAYPYLVSQQRANTALDFVACTGAKTSDVMANQIQAVNTATSIVSVTIGGNDIGFSDLIVQCTLGECSAALDSARASLPTVLSPRLDTVYSAIRDQAAAGARVVVLGYPRMFSSAGCFGTLGISSTERAKANQLAEALDGVIAARAAAFLFTYKSALAPFSTHAVCSSSSWLNGLVLFNTGESYHPNRNGQSAGYAPLVRQVVG